MAGEVESNTIFTIGHSTRPVEEFIALLRANGVTRLVDIRTIPRSRHNSQFNADTLPTVLAGTDIGYTHIAGLGGLRHALKDSPNQGWRNAGFRGFADYMQSAEFEQSLEELMEMAPRDTLALMCAEAVPWRCHRSLIADALSMRGVPVEHILSGTSRRRHELTPWARVAGSRITYPAQV